MDSESISAENVLCIVFLGESSRAGRHVTFNFATQICLNGTVSGTVEAGKESITKSVKTKTMCARIMKSSMCAASKIWLPLDVVIHMLLHLAIVAITRQQDTLNECLANIDVIRKHVMLSGESQHKAQTAGVRHRVKAILEVTRPRCILLRQVGRLMRPSISAFSARSHRSERA
jgi:hypothetical protein